MTESTAHTFPATDRYVVPGWFTRNVVNRSIRWLTRRGVPVAGSRELRVVGRRSGAVRTTVVNLLELDGTTYLVAPRGVSHRIERLKTLRVNQPGTT